MRHRHYSNSWAYLFSDQTLHSHFLENCKSRNYFDSVKIQIKMGVIKAQLNVQSSLNNIMGFFCLGTKWTKKSIPEQLSSTWVERIDIFREKINLFKSEYLAEVVLLYAVVQEQRYWLTNDWIEENLNKQKQCIF